MKISSYLLIILLLAVSISLIVFIPRWQEENYRSTINAEDVAQLEPRDRVQLQKDFALVENGFRTTLAQIVGGSLLLLSLYLTYRNVKIAQENTRIANENLRVVEEGKLTDRFSKAVELLGDEKLEIRLGGIYALERIARDSQKDHWTVMEVLTAFVRENSHRKLNETTPIQSVKPKEEKVKTREDIQTIMTVIGRRKWRDTESFLSIDLNGVNLAKCNLSKANLDGVNLNQANLTEANLSDASLRHTHLLFVRMQDVNLWSANLSEAKLSFTDLARADLRWTNLNGADLDRANLSEAKINEANLQGADLTSAKNITLEQLLSTKTYENAVLPVGLEQELKEYFIEQSKKNT